MHSQFGLHQLEFLFLILAMILTAPLGYVIYRTRREFSRKPPDEEK